METTFSFLDYAVFILYGIVIIGVGLWVSRDKKGYKKNANDYFLASKSLPWWAVGASLIASNISAEQFIGMSGSGFAIGMAIASYEWMAATTLIIVGKYFLPIFLEKKIFTMPQFLEIRYDGRVRTGLALFWLVVYVFVNLTSVMYLGALAMETIIGIPIIYGMLGLAIFAAVYSIYGGLKAVAWTDVIQVIFLIGGGLVTTYFALNAVSGGEGAYAGFCQLLDQLGPNGTLGNKFNMILEKGELFINDGNGGVKDAYLDLPGIGVLVGGLWVANLSYWGFNQYIIQRGLAAKSTREAQKGMIFAGYLKILIPLIVVVPGIVAYLLTTKAGVTLEPADRAYPWLLQNFVPSGIKGLAFAALVAAIVSSLASMLNSTATIFTKDIYIRYIDTKASENKQVKVGRITAAVALIIAVLAARPLLAGLDQAFQFIQEFTGMITPGILVIFLIGMFWKRATANAAVWVAILTIPLGFLFKFMFPGIPFLDRMGYVFLFLTLILVVISLIESKTNDPKCFEFKKSLFHTKTAFNIGAIGICFILIFLYYIWW
ncbi:MAG: sodium/sugar symporter [Bacteroidetes bacterium]|nr:sodium/sugar symporter [Bacteroidota bacterium]